MVTPSYRFGSEEIIHPWRALDSRLQVSLDLQIPTAVCAEKKGSLAYANPLLTLVDPKTKLKISWGPMLFSQRSQGDHTKPLQNIAYDAPSPSWMIRDRLVSGASWLELAPGSASYQTAPAELGWSMRDLRIVVVAGAASGAETEGSLKANPRAPSADSDPERLHTCSYAPDGGRAPDALKPAKPTLFAVHYAWYHDGAHPRLPWLPKTDALSLSGKAGRKRDTK